MEIRRTTMIIEIIGIFATLFILISMCFKTTTEKGSIYMRILNLTGSAIFVVYGILVPAWSTAILNFGLIVVNGYHLFKLLRSKKTAIVEEVQEDSKE